jgi:hypothetical protein
MQSISTGRSYSGYSWDSYRGGRNYDGYYGLGLRTGWSRDFPTRYDTYGYRYNGNIYRGGRNDEWYYGFGSRAEWSIYSPTLYSSTRYDTYMLVRGGLVYSGRKYGPFTGLSLSQ